MKNKKFWGWMFGRWDFYISYFVLLFILTVSSSNRDLRSFFGGIGDIGYLVGVFFLAIIIYFVIWKVKKRHG